MRCVLIDQAQTNTGDSTWSSVVTPAFVALAIAIGVGRFAFSPLAPMMSEDAGLSAPLVGILASANYVGYLLGAVMAMSALVAPRFGVRAGLLLIAVATFAMGLTSAVALWIVLRAVAGIASAWVLIFVSAWSSERLATTASAAAKGCVFSGVGGGMAAVGALCLLFMTFDVGSAFAWRCVALLSYLAAVTILPAFEQVAGRPRRPDIAGFKFAVRGEPMRLILCYGTCGLAYIIPATFLPLMARQIIDDASIFGWAWPVFGIAACASTLISAPLIARFSERSVWIAANCVLAVGVAVPAISDGIGAIVISALLVGGTFMVITMAGIQEARRVASEDPTLLIAALTASFALGQIAGPLAASYFLSAGTDVAWVLALASIALLAAAVSLIRGRTLAPIT